MHAVIKRRISLFIFSLIFWTCLYGCAMAPAPILDFSGDANLAELPEWIDHLTSKTVNDHFVKKWWVDHNKLKIMRLNYLKETVKQELADAPDKSVYYSNSGYLMAGAMLEKIAGKSYEQLMIAEIFNPLELHTAGFGLPLKLNSSFQPYGHKAVGATLTPISRDFPVYIRPA